MCINNALTRYCVKMIKKLFYSSTTEYKNINVHKCDCIVTTECGADQLCEG